MINAIDDISALGYDGVELIGDWREIIMNVWGTTEKFIEYLAYKHLELSGAFLSGVTLDDPARLEDALEKAEALAMWLKQCKCTNMPLSTGRRVKPTTKEQLKNLANAYNEIGKKVKPYGVKVGLHPHFQGLVENRAELDVIMELTDPQYFGFCMDTAMPILAGGDSVDDCRTYIDRIVYNGYMHIKDAKEDLRSKRDLWGRSKVQFFYELGTGKVDFPAIAKELKRANFNGWLTVECDDQMLVDPYKTARTNVKYLEDVIKKILPGPVRKPASFGYSALEIQHGPSAR